MFHPYLLPYPLMLGPPSHCFLLLLPVPGQASELKWLESLPRSLHSDFFGRRTCSKPLGCRRSYSRSLIVWIPAFLRQSVSFLPKARDAGRIRGQSLFPPAILCFYIDFCHCLITRQSLTILLFSQDLSRSVSLSLWPKRNRGVDNKEHGTGDPQHQYCSPSASWPFLLAFPFKCQHRAGRRRRRKTLTSSLYPIHCALSLCRLCSLSLQFSEGPPKGLWVILYLLGCKIPGPLSNSSQEQYVLKEKRKIIPLRDLRKRASHMSVLLFSGSLYP